MIRKRIDSWWEKRQMRKAAEAVEKTIFQAAFDIEFRKQRIIYLKEKAKREAFDTATEKKKKGNGTMGKIGEMLFKEADNWGFDEKRGSFGDNMMKNVSGDMPKGKGKGNTIWDAEV